MENDIDTILRFGSPTLEQKLGTIIPCFTDVFSGFQIPQVEGSKLPFYLKEA